MTRSLKITAVLLTVALLAGTAALLASNVAFTLTYGLLGTPDSVSGTNWLALPYKPDADVQNAEDLFQNLGGAPQVVYVARWDPVVGGLVTYSGGPDNNFVLQGGEGLVVQLQNSLDYKITGSHDPKQVITLLGPEDSAEGTSQYAHPYHGVASTAAELRNEIGPATVVSVSRWVRSADGLQSYAGMIAGNDFPLVPGESYRIQVNKTVSFVPKTRY